MQNLHHIAGGDEQFVTQMLVSFINSTEKGLKEIQDAVRSKKWESVAHLAHKLMPPCRHIGAMDLYNLLAEIEKNILDNVNINSVKTLTGKSIREFEAVRRLINGQIVKNS
jgi:HPt (histidine-containing phosphotransfer) domain-containing protein